MIPGAALSQSRATVVGTVYDSIGRTVLREARVQFFGVSGTADGRMFSAKTDSVGTFRVDSLPAGDYLAGFFHTAIDSLGIELSPRAVHVTAGRQRIDLAAPSPRQLATTLCGRLADSTAVVIGHVRSADTEEPIVGGTVLFEWTETSISRNIGARTMDRSATAKTRAAGWFTLCGVPAGSPLLIRAAFGGDTTGYVQHDEVALGLSHVSFLIGHASQTPADSSSPTTLLRGASRLHGHVSDDKGHPVANAHVEVAGTGLTAATNDVGAYVLDSLPPGTRTATVRAIGFEPFEMVVQLPTSRDALADFRFPERAVTLAATEVRSTMVYSRKLQLFEAHRKRGVGGTFLRPGVNASQMWELQTYAQQAPNTRVALVKGQWSVTMKMRRGECIPSFWLDGSRFRIGGFDELVTFVRPEDILAVEIYTRGLFLPADFTDPRSECGAIAVWKKPPPGKVKGPE